MLFSQRSLLIKGVVFHFSQLLSLKAYYFLHRQHNSHYLFLSLFLKRNRLYFNQLFAQKWVNLYPVIQVLWKRLPRSAARNLSQHQSISRLQFGDIPLSLGWHSRGSAIPSLHADTLYICAEITAADIPSRYSSASTHLPWYCERSKTIVWMTIISFI